MLISPIMPSIQHLAPAAEGRKIAYDEKQIDKQLESNDVDCILSLIGRIQGLPDDEKVVYMSLMKSQNGDHVKRVIVLMRKHEIELRKKQKEGNWELIKLSWYVSD